MDYESLESLTEALRGQDAVVSAIGKTGPGRLQQDLIDAAVAAGVKRFIPSEFGADLKIPQIAALPIYRPKVALERYLEEKATETGITYTYVYNNVILDFGIRVGSLLAAESRTIRVYDGGHHKFSTSTLGAIAKAVVQILATPEEFTNRAVRISEAAVTQRRLLEIARQITPGDEWTVVPLDTTQLVEDVQQELAQGKFSMRVFNAYAVQGAFAPGWGGFYESNDNKALGVSEMDDSGLERYLAKFFNGAQSVN